MKKCIYCLFCLLVSAIFYSCNTNVIDETAGGDNTPKNKVLVNTDPTDYTIANIFTPDGDSIYIYGDKNEDGLPVMMRDIIITPHDGEGSTEIMFDDKNNPSKVIAPNGVIMLFDWIDDKSAALTLLDPNEEEQLNTVINFVQENTETKAVSTRSAQDIVKRTGKSSLTVTPLITTYNVPNSMVTRADAATEKRGRLSLIQCNVPVNSSCWVDAYSYSGMPHSGLGTHVGRLKCDNIGEGQYEYILPSGIEGIHHNLAEHCGLIMTILTGICQTSNMLGPAYKNAICLQISASIAAGGISIGVALGFEAACTALNYSLEIFCHTGLMQGLGYEVGAVNGGDGLCNVIEAMNLQWDDELMFAPTVNALPSNIIGTVKKWDGVSSTLPSLEVTWGGNPTITQFVLEPSAPLHGQPYEATADLYCLPAGTIITLSIVGTDGYSNANVFVVGDEVNYRASLHVPGAASGVKDVCTVKLDLPDGSVKSKKASLVFQ